MRGTFMMHLHVLLNCANGLNKLKFAQTNCAWKLKPHYFGLHKFRRLNLSNCVTQFLREMDNCGFLVSFNIQTGLIK